MATPVATPLRWLQNLLRLNRIATVRAPSIGEFSLRTSWGARLYVSVRRRGDETGSNPKSDFWD